MPCYRMKTIDVQFKNMGILKAVVKELGGNVVIGTAGRDQVAVIQKDRYDICLNLTTGKAEVPPRMEKMFGEVRKAYAEAVIRQVANLKKWAVTQKGLNKIELKRF